MMQAREVEQAGMAEDTNVHIENAIGLHIAEYEILMTRNTYWATIQFSVAPAIAIYITLLVTAWEAIKISKTTAEIVVDQKNLLWLALFGAELFVLAGYNCVYEVYNNVRYVEKHLRPTIDKLLRSPSYWQYERVLEKQRGLEFFVVECWATAAVVIAEGVISVQEMPWRGYDFLWFAGTLVVALTVVAKNIEVTKIRLHHFLD